MLSVVFSILSAFIEFLKIPIIFLLLLYILFMLICGVFYVISYKKGLRPEPTHAKHVKRPGLIKSLFYYTPKQVVADYFSRPADFFQPQGLVIFTGRQGRGKTISMVEYMRHLQDSYPCAKCITNLAYEYQDDALIDWRQLIDYKNGVKGVIVGMDELQNWFGSNASRNFPPEMLSVITQNRKNRRLILGTAQNFYLLAKALRSQTTEVRECTTIAGCLTFVIRKEPFLDDKGDVKEWKHRGFYWFVHTPRIRESYDTYKVIESLAEAGFKERVTLDIGVGDL